jgi:putative nucleotidyltransferase with HDIG domain
MQIPHEVKNILTKLEAAGFEAYAVGGCVRDLLLKKKPKDWDVCTNAQPEQIQSVFPDSFYTNEFGTVGVKVQKSKIKNQNDKKKLKIKETNGQDIEIVEVTTFRADEKYSDKRHPDAVRFTENLEEDLARRDFTINALALSSKGKITDPFGGQEDLKAGIIRAVGDPEKRFNEDALRLLRAVRFSVELSFTIEEKTTKAIKKNAAWLQAIAKERIKDELVKIIMSDRPDEGIARLQELGLLEYIIPELVKGVGVAQNRHHIYTIFEHGIFSLKFAAEKKYNLAVRLAALLHDVAKPQAKRGEGPDATFYNHDILGAKTAIRILERLRFPKETIERVANLIRNHMFVYDIGAVTEAGVRRLLKRVGPENMKDLVALRVADRLGSGVPKAQPYRLRHFQYMVAKVQHDPISVKMLKINGNDIMEILKIKPGPKIGAILDVLLAEVIEDPRKNSKEHLAERARQLNEVDLASLRELAKERVAEKKEEEDQVIKSRFWVK